MAQDRNQRAKRLFYSGFSLVVTVAIFSYLLTRVSASEVLELIRRVDRRGVLMFVILSLSMSVFRTWRYRLVLRTSGYSPGSFALFLVVIVRNFFSDLLPARIGTLVYVYIVTGRLGVPFGAAASSFALSFVFDMIALAPMIVVAAVAAAGTGFSPATLVAGGVLLALITGVVLYALPPLFRVSGRLLAALTRWTRGRAAPLQTAWEAAERDIRRAREAGIYGRMLWLSVLVRLTKYGSLYVFLFALIGPLGYGFARLSVPKVFLGLCSSEFAASLPISGIAGFGAYEGAWTVSFQLLGFPARIAQLTSVSHHLFTQVYGYSLGALALLVLLLPWFKRGRPLAKAAHAVSSPVAFYGLGVLCLAVMAAALLVVYHWA